MTAPTGGDLGRRHRWCCSVRRGAGPARRRDSRRRLETAGQRHRGRARHGDARPSSGHRQPGGAGPDAVGASPADRRTPRRRGPRPAARPVPARRAADRMGARLRAAARGADRRDGVRGAGRRPRGGRAAARPRLTELGALPLAGSGRSDGGRRLAVDVDARAVRRRARQVLLVLAQRGSGEGAALRRVLGRGHRPAALDDRRTGAGAAGCDAGPGAHRRGGDHRADDPDGRRGAQPQPGRHVDAAQGVAARPDRRRPGTGGPCRGGRFVSGNDHFFLNVAMPACKLITRAASGIPGSTVVTTMARNGTDFGIQVSGTGEEWYVGPAQLADGLYLGGFGPDDANPDIGDSAIAETAGIGGFAMATAPAIVRFVGGPCPTRCGRQPGCTTCASARTPPGPSRSWSFAVRRPVSTSRRCSGPVSSRRSTPVWPAGWPAPDRSGLVSSRPPMECFTAAIAGLATAACPLPTCQRELSVKMSSGP